MNPLLSSCPMNAPRLLYCVALVPVLLAGCGKPSATPHASQPAASVTSPTTEETSQSPLEEPPIVAWEKVESLPKEIAVFDHVFWEPGDTDSLRRLIREEKIAANRSVLEIGTGSGIVALCCLQAGARDVVASDINPWAIRNVTYNAKLLKVADRLSVRQVAQNRSNAWSVIGDDERFDLIISNPPWEPGKPTKVEDFAFYDPDFRLMKSIVDGMDDHLHEGGRVLLAYGCVSAIRHLQSLADERDIQTIVHDDRNLDELPELFLPGMLIELQLKVEEENQ